MKRVLYFFSSDDDQIARETRRRLEKSVPKDVEVRDGPILDDYDPYEVLLTAFEEKGYGLEGAVASVFVLTDPRDGPNHVFVGCLAGNRKQVFVFFPSPGQQGRFHDGIQSVLIREGMPPFTDQDALIWAVNKFLEK